MCVSADDETTTTTTTPKTSPPLSLLLGYTLIECKLTPALLQLYSGTAAAGTGRPNNNVFMYYTAGIYTTHINVKSTAAFRSVKILIIIIILWEVLLSSTDSVTSSLLCKALPPLSSDLSCLCILVKFG